MLPYICMFVVDNLWSVYLDKRIAGGTSIRSARVLSQNIAFLVPAASLVILMFVPSPSIGYAGLMKARRKERQMTLLRLFPCGCG
mgnify:CR=1 FL=1